MQTTSPTKITKSFVDLSTTQRRNLTILTLGMLKSGTVVLNKVKKHLGAITGKTDTDPNSHYKRLNRIFQDYSSGQVWLSVLKASQQLVGNPGKYLFLDGSSWKTYGFKHHFMTLCSVVDEAAVPIWWKDLHKLGASSVDERLELLEGALEHYRLAGKILLADREYLGKRWFKALIDNKIDFVIRSRYRAYFEQIDQADGPSMEEMIQRVRSSKKANKAVRKRFELDELTLWVVVAKNPNFKAKEDYQILLTNRDESPYKTVQHYLMRWKIEHCFKHLKSNGFDLEKMNVEGVKRQRLLFTIVVLCYAASIRKAHKKYGRVGYKNYADDKKYKAISRFRFGYDWLVSTLHDYGRFTRWLMRQIATGKNLNNQWILKIV